MSKHVFISYDWNDRNLVNKAIRQLQKDGLISSEPVTSTETMFEPPSGAADIRATIKESILTSDVFVLVWSKRAADSAWVQYELGMAEALERPIVVVVTDKTAPQLPKEIEDKQVVQLDAEIA